MDYEGGEQSFLLCDLHLSLFIRYICLFCISSFLSLIHIFTIVRCDIERYWIEAVGSLWPDSNHAPKFHDQSGDLNLFRS